MRVLLSSAFLPSASRRCSSLITLLNPPCSHLTDTKSEEAAYEFTTLTCIPGNVYYKGCRIQLLDLPGIIEGAAYGRGRGRQVIAVAKSWKGGGEEPP